MPAERAPPWRCAGRRRAAGGLLRPPGLGGARARRRSRVDHVDVDRQEHRVAVVHGDRHGLGEAGVEAPGHHLGHLEAAHALVGHPGQRRGLGPVAAQARSAGTGRPGPPPTRSAGASACRDRSTTRTGCRRCRRGRRNGSPTPGPTPRGGPRPVTSGQAMVWSPPRITGRAPGCGHLLHRRLQAGHRRLDLAGRHLDVADVDHPELDQRVDAEGQVGPAAVVRQIVGQPDGLRAEAGARAVRRARRRRGRR